MTLTDTRPRLDIGRPWTFEDLIDLPDDGMRYEISDGSLLVTPPPALPHTFVLFRVLNLIRPRGPRAYALVENVGVLVDGRTYRIPDTVLIRLEALEHGGAYAAPRDILLAIEVISPGAAGDDAVTKRAQYGRAGIPHYWIVDPNKRTLTVLVHDGQTGYVDKAVVPAGQAWETDDPFPIRLDPADFT